MIQTVRIRAQSPWKQKDIALFHQEPLSFEISDRASDQLIVLTIGPDSAAAPVYETVGEDAIVLDAAALSVIPEGATYHYNIWSQRSGQLSLLQRGKLFVRRSIAPSVLPVTLSAGTLSSATVGTPFSYAPIVIGGTAPYSFDLVAGDLPAGLALNPATGQIYGVPSVAGLSIGISLRVTDTANATATLPAFDIMVEDPVSMPDPIAVTADAPLLLIDGDSIMDYNATRLVLEHYVGHQFRKPQDYNQARAGDTTQQILDGTQAVVDQIESGRTVVLVGPTGANQATGSSTFAEMSAQQQQIYDTYLAAGAIVVAVPTLPETDIFGGLDEKDALLAWVYAHETGGSVSYGGTGYAVTPRTRFYAVDIGTPDRGQVGAAAYGPADFNPYTMKNDQTHPNGEGSRYLAERIAAVLDGLVSSEIFAEVSPNLLGSDMTFGGVVTATRPGITGDVPSGWDVSRSGSATTWVCSKDGNDNLVASVTGAGNNSTLSVAIDVQVNGGMGDVFDMVAEVDVIGAENGFRGLRIIAEEGTDSQGDADFYPGRSTLSLRSVSAPLMTAEATKTFTIQALVETGATVSLVFKRAAVFFVETLVTDLLISGTPTLNAQVGAAYSFVPTVNGGQTPYSFDLAGGSLPDGLSLSTATGAITGTPTAPRTAAGIILRVTDFGGRMASLPAFDLTVASMPVPVNTGVPVLNPTAPTEGETVSVTTGSWTNAPTGYAYRWYYNGVLQAGEIGASHTPQTGSANTVLTAEVRAENTGGWSDWSVTAPSDPVAESSSFTPVPWDAQIANGQDLAFSDGDRTVNNTHSNNNRHCRGVQPMGNKVYFEIATTFDVRGVGIADETMTAFQTKTLGVNCAYWTGTGILNGSTNNVGGSYDDGDVVQVAVDRTLGLIWVRKNGTGEWNGDPADDPVTGAGGIDVSGITSPTVFPMVSLKPGGITTLQGSPDRIIYAVPAGFTTLP
ncbi:MAG: putative Ig domain-containing protein [Pseudomonadota bacterium]